jgi:hypothetical protein
MIPIGGAAYWTDLSSQRLGYLDCNFVSSKNPNFNVFSSFGTGSVLGVFAPVKRACFWLESGLAVWVWVWNGACLCQTKNKQIAEVIAKAPKNVSYTLPMIQKEILQIFSTQVNEAIRKEVSNAKFCIIVDEARDESMNEQMALVLRFVDKDGFVRERAAMNNVKIRLCNKIEDEFLTDSLMVYIESEVAATISINSIIDDFWDSKK